MVPYEAFLSEKPVLTTTDAGGPLEVVADGTHRARHRARAGELARAAGRLREHPDEARAFGQAGREIAARVTWDSCLEQAARREGRATSRRCRRSGRGSPTTARTCCRRCGERIDVEVVRRGRKRPVRGTDLALYHVGNNPDAHGWIVDALRRRGRASSCCTTSSCTTSSRA